jgi:amidohydrolase
MQPDSLIKRLVEIRRELHALAEPPGHEKRTAAYLADLLKSCNPTSLLEGVGGHGLVAEFAGVRPGPRVGLRAELDGLAEAQGARHGCGHDGHMALLCGVALSLADHPPRRGVVTLIFQPAEETGQGAAAMLADPRWPGIAPDLIFALHNLPGMPLGQAALRDGVMNMASTGLEVCLIGAISHAAQPEKGISPAPVLARLLDELPALAKEGELLTLTHARLGDGGYGTAPGEALLQATLRAPSNEALASLRARVEIAISQQTSGGGLDYGIRLPEPFAATDNHHSATQIVRRGANETGLDLHEPEQPFRWSEDFGLFTAEIPGALFCLGAGENHPALHASDYEFPDELLETGLSLWLAIWDQAVIGSR